MSQISQNFFKYMTNETQNSPKALSKLTKNINIATETQRMKVNANCERNAREL